MHCSKTGGLSGIMSTIMKLYKFLTLPDIMCHIFLMATLNQSLFGMHRLHKHMLLVAIFSYNQFCRSSSYEYEHIELALFTLNVA